MCIEFQGNSETPPPLHFHWKKIEFYIDFETKN